MLLLRISIIAALFSGISASAQTYWVHSQAGPNVDETLGIASDNTGNTYTTGYFSSSAAVNEINVSTAGLTDVFVSKIGPNGASLWSVKAGGTQSDRGLGVAVDAQGNVFVCGFFTGSMNFGNGISITANSNSQDAFVAKYNNTGTALWARAGGSSGSGDRASAIAVDSQGNVSITGQFSGEATFGSLSLSSQGGSVDVFIVKYNSDGLEQWAKKGSGSAIDRGLALTTDNNGGIYAAGQFSGDITFDNSYPNSILNALFLVKYSSSGAEEWFRWAGGPSQSIAYGLTSDGSNVYLTGDCGASITFLNGSGTNLINSGYDNGVFIASYSSSGQYLWGTAQGSDSPISSRAISYRNNQLALTGWHECTFDALSTVYGESTFNSLGFKDVWVMRYASGGQFTWARNFGSQTNEIATGVALTPDGYEVVTGVFNNTIYFPLLANVSNNLEQIIPPVPNFGQTYCSDSGYGQFSSLTGSGAEDGFTGKLINPDRKPMDMFVRFGAGCDLSIPDACINLAGSPILPTCPEELIGCPPYQITAYWGMVPNSPISFGYNVSWIPSGVGNLTINAPTNVTAVLTSIDGCYSTTVKSFADIYPPAAEPAITDNAGYNNMATAPVPIYLCPDETVDITGSFPPGYTYDWAFTAGVVSENGPTITVDSEGFYNFIITNPNGCTENVIVLVIEERVPPIVDPVLIFNSASDTVVLCSGTPFSVTAADLWTGAALDYLDFDFTWSISPSGSLGGLNPAGGTVSQEGWYYVTVEIESEENFCDPEIQEYEISDSVYIQMNPTPESFASITGPGYSCAGDTLVLYVEHLGEVTYNFTPLEIFEDSVWVVGPGLYSISVLNVNEFGCMSTSISSLAINSVTNPVITTNEDAVICPGDSVLLFTNSPGNIIWQGPNGAFESGEQSIYVDEEGLYFIEASYYPGCALVSNTIQIAEYATPFIAGSNAVLCPGDTVEISIISTSIDDILWLEPLSGSDTIQFITSPGTYQAEVTSCGITTLVSIQVELSTYDLAIELLSEDPVCFGDSLQVGATPGYSNYTWTPDAAGITPYFYQSGIVHAQATDPNGCLLSSNTLNLNFEPVPPAPVFTFTPVCEGETQVITINSPFSVQFTDGDQGPILIDGNVMTIPNFMGDTTVYAFLNSPVCSGPSSQATVVAKLYPEQPILGSDAPVCTGTLLQLGVANAESNVIYTWLTSKGTSLVGANVSYFIQDISYEGLYACWANLDGCIADTSYIPIELFETRQVVLPPDTGLCTRNNLIIRPDTIFDTYFWQDGSGDSLFVPTESGTYFLMVTDFNGCRSFDEMNLELINCDFIIPNIFTPNADGINDSWLVFAEEPLYFWVVVYNRWGLIVYESNDYQRFWDGIHYKSEEPCSEGVYFYIIRARDFENFPFEATGPLTLIRD